MTDNLRKQDLELILEVNKKAVEIETAVVEQNEEIIASLDTIKQNQELQDEKLSKLVKQSEETNRDIFKIQILFLTGVVSLVIQIIQILKKN